LVPWVAPKFVPVIVTWIPTLPEVVDRLVMLGAGATVNKTPLLAVPPTVTTTFPVVAPVGTVETMLVVVQVEATPAGVPLTATVLVPCVPPKPFPVMVTPPRIGADVGERLLMTGVTVKMIPLLATPPTLTTTLPLVALEGTGTAILPVFQLVGVPGAPLNVTVLEPWVAPKFAPVIVTGVPAGPVVADKLVMLGAAVTVNKTPLLPVPLTVTTTFPVVAPAGTVTTMLVVVQVGAVPAEMPLNVTVLVPCAAPKPLPVMVTEAVTAPDVCERLLMTGVTAKFTPLLFTPLACTTTLPVVAPGGTETAMLVGLQLVGVAVVPLNVTVLEPWVAPKFVPVIVTGDPTGPEGGDKLVMLGGGVSVNKTPLLCVPLTVTKTFPVVAPAGTFTAMLIVVQVSAAPAAVPLNVTVLAPCVPPKPLPVMFTEAPAAPAVGERVMVGVTVKLTPLLFTPLACTTTLPVVAPVGTGTPMLVALQLVGIASAPLNVTLPVPWVAPKFVPVIVTVVVSAVPEGPHGVFSGAHVGDRLVMLGGGTTVNKTPLVAVPFTVTTAFPVVAPAGTVATMLVAVQFVTVAAVPLNMTVFVPCAPPNPLPAMVTEAPTAPVVGKRLVMAGITVKCTPLLLAPPTWTTTLPVVAPAGTGTAILVAFQLVGAATSPLNVTVLEPWVAPKYVPVIVTDVPTGPKNGLISLMIGVWASVGLNVTLSKVAVMRLSLLLSALLTARPT
jgi:hypothetical protein